MKTSVLRVRVTPAQLKSFKKDAAKRGITLSAHILERLVAYGLKQGDA